MENQAQALGFDDEITGEVKEGFKIIPPQYVKIELAKNPDRSKKFQGSAKSPACPIVEFELKATTRDGDGLSISHGIFWNTYSQSEIASLMLCFGWVKAGERGKIPWQQAVGAKGFAKTGIREVHKKDKADGSLLYDDEGKPQMAQFMKIDKFIPRDTEEWEKAKSFVESSSIPNTQEQTQYNPLTNGDDGDEF